MFKLLADQPTIIHSSGINWGQSLATWIPIVLALIGGVVATIRSVMKWNKARALRAENLVTGLIQSFGATLNVRFEQIEEHLKNQDKQIDEQSKEFRDRFNRVDRNTGTNST